MVYSALLVHEKEYVRAFAGESFAYLLRRLPGGKLKETMGRMTEGEVLLDVLSQALLAEDKRLVVEEEEEEKERLEREEKEREEREAREAEERENGMEVDEEEEEEEEEEGEEKKKEEQKEEEPEEEKKSKLQMRLEDDEGRVGRVVKMFPLYVDGVSKLVWSTMKGVRGGLHSKAGGVFEALLSSICFVPLSLLPSYTFVCGKEVMERMREEVGGEKELRRKREGMAGKVLAQVMEGTNYSSMEPLWEVVDELWKDHLEGLTQAFSAPSFQGKKKQQGGKKKKGEMEVEEPATRTTLSVPDVRSFCCLLGAIRDLVGYRLGKHSLPAQKLWENISLTLQNKVWEWVFGGEKKKKGEEEKEAGVELLDGMLRLHGDCYGLLVRQAGMGGVGGAGSQQELPPMYMKYLGASLGNLLKVIERGEEDYHVRAISRYLERVCVFPSFSKLYLKGVVEYLVGMWGKKGGKALSVGQIQSLSIFSDIAWAQQQPPSLAPDANQLACLQKDARKAFRPLQLLSSSPSSSYVISSKEEEEEEKEEEHEVGWEMYDGLVGFVEQFAKIFEGMAGNKKKRGAKKGHVRGEVVTEVTEVDMMSLWLCLRGLSILLPSLSPSEFSSSKGFKALHGLCNALLSLPSSFLDSPLLTSQSAAIQTSDHKGKQQVFRQLPILPPSDLSSVWSPLAPPPLDGVFVWMRGVAGLLVGEAMRAMGAMGKAVGKKEKKGDEEREEELVWGAVLDNECFWALLKKFSTDFHVVSAVADVVAWCVESLREKGGGWVLSERLLNQKERVEVLECLPLALSHPSLSLRTATVDLLCNLPLREGEEMGGEGGNGGMVMYEQFRGLMGAKLDALNARDGIYRIDNQMMGHINNIANLPPPEQKLLVHFLVGLFHLHFAPFWRPTQNALAAISRTAPTSFYPLISPFLVGRPSVDDVSLPALPAVPDSYQFSSPSLRQQKWLSVDLSSHFYREVRRLEEDIHGTSVGGDSFFDSVWGVFCVENFKVMGEKKGVDKFPLHKYFWVLISQYFPSLLGKMTGDYASAAISSSSSSMLPVEMQKEIDEGGDVVMGGQKALVQRQTKKDTPTWALTITKEDEETYSFHPRGGLTWLESKNKLRAILRVCEKMPPKAFPGGAEGGVFGAIRGVIGHMLQMPLPEIQVFDLI